MENKKYLFAGVACLLAIVISSVYTNIQSSVFSLSNETYRIPLSLRGNIVDAREVFPSVLYRSLRQNGSDMSVKMAIYDNGRLVEIVPVVLPSGISLYYDPVVLEQSMQLSRKVLQTEDKNSFKAAAPVVEKSPYIPYTDLGRVQDTYVNEYGFANPEMVFDKSDPRYEIERQKKQAKFDAEILKEAEQTAKLEDVLVFPGEESLIPIESSQMDVEGTIDMPSDTIELDMPQDVLTVDKEDSPLLEPEPLMLEESSDSDTPVETEAETVESVPDVIESIQEPESTPEDLVEEPIVEYTDPLPEEDQPLVESSEDV